MVHPGDSSSDGVAHLSLSNPRPRPVRVAAVRIAFLGEGQTLRVDEQDDSFFHPDAGERPARVDRGPRIEWRGICLDRIPDGADRVRIELDLSGSMGAEPRRVRQVVEAPLVRIAAPSALQLPFEGPWRVSQGHGCATDHRLAGYGSDFAWDFVAIDARTGRPVSDGFSQSRRNRDTVSFGRPVLAPAAGTVVRVEADVPDNDALRDYPGRSLVEDLSHPLWNFGNHIVVALPGGGPYLLLAHLRQGSIRVAAGASIRPGDVLAEVGNSGRSVEPHLHLQVMDRADPADRSVSGIPALFHDYVELTTHGVPGKRNSVLRRVATGDPPEGAVVIPAGVPRREEKPADQSGG